MASLYSLV